MEDLNILQTIINGGPAVILAVGLVIVWRAWRAELKKKDDIIVVIRQLLEKTQDQRVEDAQHWSEKYSEMASQVQQSLTALERLTQFIERLTSRGGTDVP